MPIINRPLLSIQNSAETTKYSPKTKVFRAAAIAFAGLAFIFFIVTAFSPTQLSSFSHLSTAPAKLTVITASISALSAFIFFRSQRKERTAAAGNQAMLKKADSLFEIPTAGE